MLAGKRELLIAMARAAECVSNKDRGTTNHFKGLICRLERIGDLDDVTEIRSAIVRRVTELKDGRAFVLRPGMSYQVADGAEPHRSYTRNGAKLFVVD